MVAFELYTQRFGLTRFPETIVSQPRLAVLEMILQGLNGLPRFGGHHGRPTWSVLQHSLLVARLVRDDLKAEALLHDAPEALIVDLPGPVKRFCPDYKRIEADIYFTMMLKLFDRAIIEPHPEIKRADQDAQCAEAWQFFPTCSVHGAPTDAAREGLWELLSHPVPYDGALAWARELLDI